MRRLVTRSERIEVTITITTTLYHSCQILLVRLGGYIMILSDFDSYKKTPRHMSFGEHTRSTGNSSNKIDFSDSFQSHRGWCFTHYEGHTGWQGVVYVYHTCLCRRFRPENIIQLQKRQCLNVQKFTTCDISKGGWCFFRKRGHPVDFSTLTWQSWEVHLQKIWRFESAIQYIVKSNTVEGTVWSNVYFFTG